MFRSEAISELAAAKKLDIVLAGRNKDTLVALGDRLSLPTRVVGLNDATQLSEALKDIACVVHMAGSIRSDFRSDVERVLGDANELHRYHW